MARKRKGRAVDGVVLVNKPSGMTSNQVLQKVRWLFNAEKAGHTGTLDPSATGLLPICLGEATKFSRFLLDASKAYETVGVLGVTTDTLDADGVVQLERPIPSALNIDDIEQILVAFRGDILQVPPMYSALKRDGKKLVDLARQGIEVELEARPVSIFNNQLVSLALPEFTLSVTCSKGTYIRTLVADIGEALGCGAYVKLLHRTQHGRFSVEQAVSLEHLQDLRDNADFNQLDQHLIGINRLLEDLPPIDVPPDRAHYFSNGNDINFDAAPGTYRVYCEQRFLGVGVVQLGRLQPERLIRQS